MGPGFRRLVHAAFAGGLLGCETDPQCEPFGGAQLPDPPEDPGGGSGERPVLLEARFLGPNTLELRFSEKMAPVNEVEPLDFRVSLATTRTNSAYYDCSVLTTYADLGGAAPAAVTSLWNVSSALDRVRLSLALPVTPAHCNTIETTRAGGEEAGLFIHYSAGDGASVQDLDGDALADIAAPWAIAATDPYYSCGFYSYYYAGPCILQGLFPNMDAWLPIPCPRP